MKKKMIPLYAVVLALGMSACASHYSMTGISRSRILVDQRYDAQPDRDAMAFVAPYQHQVDSMMGPVVGKVASYMSAGRPESALSNLLADILLWSGKQYGEQPEFAVYNMGGIRAALSKGDVTIGNVLDVAPFENKVCYLTLTGAKVKELFSQIAGRKGEGVSRGVKLTIDANGGLQNIWINGQPIDEAKKYRVATLDYLAHGNDGLVAFKDATEMNVPKEKKDNVRELIANYFREKTKEGEVVESKIEGRITVVK